MKMKRFFAAMLAVTAMALAMTGCGANKVENTEGVNFTATPSKDKITVKIDGGEKQELDLLISAKLYDPSLLQIADYNFDGYNDIAFPSNYNDKNTIYQLWLYDAASAQFVEYKGFGENYNPTLDAEKKQINTVAYTDPVTTSTAVLEWRDGAFVTVALTTKTQDGQGLWVITEFAMNEETGVLEVVKAETEPVEGYDEIVNGSKE